MTVSVVVPSRKPREEQVDKTARNLDLILKGLTIAEKVHGLLPEDNEAINRLREAQTRDLETRTEQLRRQEQSIVTGPEELELQRQGAEIKPVERPAGPQPEAGIKDPGFLRAQIQPGSTLLQRPTGEQLQATIRPPSEDLDKLEKKSIEARKRRLDIFKDFDIVDEKTPGAQRGFIPTAEGEGLEEVFVIPRSVLDKRIKDKSRTTEEKIVSMPAETKKRYDSTVLALKGLTDMKEVVRKNKSRLARISLVGDNEYTTARRLFVEGLARAQTGAAMTQREVEIFESFAPRVTDREDIVELKLKQLEFMLNSRVRGFGISPEEALTFGEQQKSSIFDELDGRDPEEQKRILIEAINARKNVEGP